MVKRFLIHTALCVLVPLLGAACERRGSDAPRLKPEVVWDLSLGEPSGLAALPDGRLLSVGDGDRARVYEIALDHEVPATRDDFLDLHALKENPRGPFSGDAMPDLEAVAPGPDGTLFLGLEYWNEIWRLSADRRQVLQRRRLPDIAPEGSVPECLGPKANHGLEGLAYDPGRRRLLAAHERCPPALVLFADDGETPLRVFTRADLNAALAAASNDEASNDKEAKVGTFSALTWAEEPGEFLLVDRLRRELVLLRIDETPALRIAGRWSFAGVFRESGLHRQYGNVEGVALTRGALYLITDPGESAAAQLARFPWPLPAAGRVKAP